MSLEDVVAMLLDGSTGLGEILGDFQDHHEMVRIAVAALKVTDDLQAVSEAMTARGLHPLSLLCSGGADLQAWITENSLGMPLWQFPDRTTPCLEMAQGPAAWTEAGLW
jgi:hypothetical protein